MLIDLWHWFLGCGWVFIGLVCLLSLGYAFHEHRELWQAIKESLGAEKRWAISKLIFVWSLPIISGFAAIITQAGSDADEKRIVDLEAKEGPRHITKAQYKKLFPLLQASQKGMVFVVAAALGEYDEANAYHDDIWNILRDSGFVMMRKTENMKNAASFNHAGTFIEVKDKTHIPGFATDIQTDFGKIGVEMPIYDDSSDYFSEIPEDAIIICIGVKL